MAIRTAPETRSTVTGKSSSISWISIARWPGCRSVSTPRPPFLGMPLVVAILAQQAEVPFEVDAALGTRNAVIDVPGIRREAERADAAVALPHPGAKLLPEGRAVERISRFGGARAPARRSMLGRGIWHICPLFSPRDAKPGS